MNLTYLGAGAFTVGLLGLLGITYLLQRLRVRHEERVVPTTLFWRQALEEERARVLVERFRHPWAWLLVAGITSLLWLALSRPSLNSGEERLQVVLVESSTDPVELAERIGAAAQLVDQLPRDRTEVVLLGAQLDTLLGANESPALFDERAGDQRLASPAVGLDDAVLRLVRGRSEGVDLHLVGATPLRQSTLDSLGEELELRRIAPVLDAGDGSAADETALLGLGTSASADGDPERVDLVATVRASSADGFQWFRGEQALEQEPVITARDGLFEFGFEGLRADGSVIRLEGRGLDASVRLPEGRKIRVSVDEALGLFLRGYLIRAIDSDPGLERTAVGQADVALSGSAASEGSSVPTLAFLEPAALENTFEIGALGGEFADILRELALDQIDATMLATELGLPVTVGEREVSQTKTIEVDRRAVGPRTSFAGSRAFPLFIGGAIRWLSGTPRAVDHLAVGEPVEASVGAVRGPDARDYTVLGDRFVPLDSGAYELGASDPSRTPTVVLASVQNPLPGVALDQIEPVTSDSGGSVPPFARIALLLVLGLLGLEWFLVRRGRMP